MKSFYATILILVVAGCGPSKDDLIYVQTLVENERQELNQRCMGKLEFRDFTVRDLKVQDANDDTGAFGECQLVTATIDFIPASANYYYSKGSWGSHLEGLASYADIEGVATELTWLKGSKLPDQISELGNSFDHGAVPMDVDAVAKLHRFQFCSMRYNDNGEWKHINNGRRIIEPIGELSWKLSEDYVVSNLYVICDHNGQPNADGLKRIQARKDFDEKCNLLIKRIKENYYYVIVLKNIKEGEEAYPRYHNWDDKEMGELWEKFNEIYDSYSRIEKKMKNYGRRLVDVSKLEDPGAAEIKWMRLSDRVKKLKANVDGAQDENERMRLTKELEKTEKEEDDAFTASTKAAREYKDAIKRNCDIYPEYEKDAEYLRKNKDNVENAYKAYSQIAKPFCELKVQRFVSDMNKLKTLVDERYAVYGQFMGR